MTLNELQTHQPDLFIRMCGDFRHLDRAKLLHARHDWKDMVAYFAQTYELTVTEAGETLDDWLSRRIDAQILSAA